MRILWHSPSPLIPGGYSGQAALNIPVIASLGHEVIISSFAGGSYGHHGEWNGFQVLPPGQRLHGNGVIRGHYERVKADLLIILNDAWGIEPTQLAGMNVMPWMPLDTEPLGGLDRIWLEQATEAGAWVRPLAMSRFGLKQLQDAGWQAEYVPHSVDPAVFFPDHPAGQLWRKQHNLPDDAFLVVMNAANKGATDSGEFGELSRKAFAQQMEAFAQFSARHKKAALYMHTRPDDQAGMNLYPLAELLGMQGRIVFPEPYLYDTAQYSQDWLRGMYSAADVLTIASAAEGFGLPIIEAMACGTPVVATRGSAMTELVTPETGWLADSQKHYVNGHRSFWRMPLTYSIAQCYEKAFTGARMKSRNCVARAEKYHVTGVAEKYWKPALAVVS